ncbi:Follistatin-like domain-containing protein [Caenorhabditis elegans]|uniref:Follistatin-like domain-containing protein n=1 Tax=Caenorhabditis elegans TaxID=6239 RepID=L8EC37_CAEEL|nr:Follistatin-like domain-containing protein [Caenorhabditis elegans]CCQ25696.1 Follistatin-like domain-containing protein [Caenorhabditis elegans]|eukprot:NP_001263950.1 Uncharacterized protein CELE_F46B3.14 [Caenorhabditis elegans]
MKYILCLLLAGGISARVAPIESIVGPGAPCIGEECGDNLSNPCSLIKCSNGSHCVPRGTTGRCVLDSNPCASIKCGRGYHCAVENGQGGCVPNVPSEVDLCSLVKCALGGHCENGNCVPDVPSEYDLCSQVKCAIGSRCKNGTASQSIHASLFSAPLDRNVYSATNLQPVFQMWPSLLVLHKSI